MKSYRVPLTWIVGMRGTAVVQAEDEQAAEDIALDLFEKGKLATDDDFPCDLASPEVEIDENRRTVECAPEKPEGDR